MMTPQQAGALLGGVAIICPAVIGVAHAGELGARGDVLRVQNQPPPDMRTPPGMGSGRRPSRELNTMKDVNDAFFACWKAPSAFDARPGMEITIRFALSRTGEIIGEPRFTFASPDVPPDVRAVYQRSIADAFKTCTPFPLSPSLGGAIAGRPQSLRFFDGRGQQRI
jgi:hypothetical protein